MIGTKEVAAILGVKDVTVRKYAMALEAAGYSFERIGGKNREYSEVDVTVFQQLVTICNHSGLNISAGAELVASKYSSSFDAHTSVAVARVETGNIEMERYAERYVDLENTVKSLSMQNEQIMQQNESLLSKISEQEDVLRLILEEIQGTTSLMVAQNEKKGLKFWKQWLSKESGGPDPERFWKRREKSIY